MFRMMKAPTSLMTLLTQGMLETAYHKPPAPPPEQEIECEFCGLSPAYEVTVSWLEDDEPAETIALCKYCSDESFLALLMAWRA